MDRPLYIVTPPPRVRRRQPPGWGTMLHRPLHQSITEVRELELVRNLLASNYERNTILNVHGLESADALILPEVQLPKDRGKCTGDVDILVVPNGAPDQATAIQVKRFELTLRADDEYDATYDEYNRTGDPKKLPYAIEIDRMARTFAEGVEQANRDSRRGFWQVYLWVFLLVDSRVRNAGRLTYDGLDSCLHSRVNQAISTAGLLPRVGLMKFEWAQAIDRPPFTNTAGGSSLERLATAEKQPDDLTNWICTLRPDPKHRIAPSWRLESQLVIV